VGRRAKPHFGQNCTLNNDRLAQSFRVPFKPYLILVVDLSDIKVPAPLIQVLVTWPFLSAAVTNSAILMASGMRELSLQPIRKISRANSLSNSNVCTITLRLPLRMRRYCAGRDLVVVEWL